MVLNEIKYLVSSYVRKIVIYRFLEVILSYISLVADQHSRHMEAWISQKAFLYNVILSVITLITILLKRVYLRVYVPMRTLRAL